MRAKLGLVGEESEDEGLIEELLQQMEAHQADYTNTFRLLTYDKPEETVMHGSAKFKAWLERWQARRQGQGSTAELSQELMRRSNPAVIPRNHRVEEALAAAEDDDLSVMQRLLEALADPYAHASEQEAYCSLPEKSDQSYRTYCGT